MYCRRLEEKAVDGPLIERDPDGVARNEVNAACGKAARAMDSSR
jgi:hypothetical protein